MEFEGQETGTSGAFFLYHVASTVCRGESNQTGPAEMEETGTMSMETPVPILSALGLPSFPRYLNSVVFCSLVI